MTTLHLVRPELRGFVQAFSIPEMNAEQLAAMRQAPAVSLPPPEVTDLIVEERHIPGPSGAPDVRVLVYRPGDVSGLVPAILHFHGGGYLMGSPEMNDAANRLQSVALGAIIVSVDYRLAPEQPFPAPLEDGYAALQWLHANAEALSVDPTRIALKGESAGAGLAAGLALLARDRGEVTVAFQCLTYPMLDDRPLAEPHPFVGEYVWTAPSNRFAWEAYLGPEAGGPNVSAYAAPARAKDLTGLPATLIVVGTLDLFFEENLDYARRLARAGVSVELLVYPGVYHGFHMAGDTEINRRRERDVRDALAAALWRGA